MENKYILSGNPPVISDEEIIKKITWWDVPTFEIIYDRYKNQIYNYVWTLLNYNWEEAGLVLSDVFIKAYEYIINKKVDNLKSLLYRIAHNTAIDWIRSNKVKDVVIDVDIDHPDPFDGKEKEKIDINYKKKLIKKYMSELDEKYRSVLYLLYYEDKSYDEIAMIQNSNKNTVWTLALQGKKKLKEIMISAGVDPNIFLI